MDIENSTNDTTEPAAPAANATQPAPFVVTPEVEAYAAEKANKAAAAARREALGKKSEPQPKPKQNETTEAAVVAVRDQAFEDSLADALAEEKELTKDQRQLIRKLARMESPGDVDDYVTRMAKTFGITPKPPTAAHSAAPVGAAPAPTSPPRAAAPAPSSQVPADVPDRVTQMSMADVSAHLAKVGAPNPANPMHWSNAAALAELHRRLDAEMAGTRLTSSNRR